MKAKELTTKSVEELNSLKADILKEQFNLRMQHGSGQLPKNHLLRQARRNVARINTILNDKRKAS